jgi:hypothetical protein
MEKNKVTENRTVTENWYYVIIGPVGITTEDIVTKVLSLNPVDSAQDCKIG